MKYSSLFIALVLFFTLPLLPALSAERPSAPKPAGARNSSPAPTVLSIIPAQAEPGSAVAISGTGFGENVTVTLGTREIPARTIENRKIEFTVPQKLEAGIYVLFLKREDGTAGRAYNFTVLPLKPVLSGLSPDQINACAEGRDREVTAVGRNFNESSALFFDGAAIRSRLVSSEAIVFSVPQVTGGLHQVMVRNSADNSSVAQGLSINTKPEISHVSIGNQYVNYYDLNIEGRNFSPNSVLYVDGQRVGSRDNPSGERERMIYMDCGRIVYQRYPYSPVNKEFRVQIVNQEGQGSQVINVSAP